MTVTAMELHGYFGEKFPLFSVERTRDAIAAYCEIRWPVGRRKSVAREWDLTADEARSVCEASASQATLDKIYTHKRGGWAVMFPVFGALIGQTAEQFIENERRRHVEQARRLGALVADFRPGHASSRDGPDSLPEPPDRRSEPERKRVG